MGTLDPTAPADIVFMGSGAGSAAAKQRGVAARAAAWMCAGDGAATPAGERWSVYELTLALERALTAWCAALCRICASRSAVSD
jgi:hypothetical protein